MTTPLSPVETVMTAPLATIDHTASARPGIFDDERAPTYGAFFGSDAIR